MYLKQIDIVGFKSFADKSQIVLSPGVTAVVGPNGSGKSNIADAIRWVLGEQSVRNLRGSKMEDVIFAGSELRKPTNLCEVSLTLDNSDRHLPVVFDEVTITRRVFRSGESEYYINRQPCRLKDIHELFMDTGLGRDAYSIIGQGKIEEMLSTRPEDRRGPFEDAAGIVKFKHRRKEAERKLEDTENNLIRVDDILAELTQQLAPLAEERARAEQYQQLSDALEEAEITLLVVEIDRLHERFQQATAAVSGQQAVRDEAQAALSQAEAAWREARASFEETVSQVEALQQRYVRLVEERQRSQGDLALIDQRLEHLAAAAEARQTRRMEQARELEDIERELSHANTALHEVTEKLGERAAQLNEVATSASEEQKNVLTAEIEEMSAELIEVNHRAASLRNELKMLAEQAASDAGKRARFEQDQARFQAQIDEVAAAHRKLAEQVVTLEADMERAAARIEEHDRVREEAAEAEATTVTELHRLRAEMQAMQARLELLRDLEQGYDGYALGVRTVLQQAHRGALTGIHGSLAELVHVDKKYEIAIETALGGALQNVVVDREADARAAIQLLKQRQAGRATFMPLDVIKSRRLREGDLDSVRGQDGFLGVASDLVDADPVYRQAVEHLLGNVLIAASLERANALARDLQYRYRIVTLQGDVVSPGGMMTGGHVNRKGPGLLGRSRERQDVEQKLRELQESERTLIERQQLLREQVSQAQQARFDAQKHLEGLANERQQLQEQMRQLEYQQKSAAERLEALAWEAEQLQSGSDAIALREQTAQQGLVDAETALASLTEALAAKRKELTELEQRLAEAQEQVTGLRIEVATLRQEREGLRAREQELANRAARLREAIAILDVEAQTAAAEERDLRQEAASKRSGVQSLFDAVAEGEQQLELARQTRLEREATARQVEGVAHEARQAVAREDELLHRAVVAAERADADLAHALQKMGDNHGMTYEWAKSRYPLTGSVDDLEREVQSLRRRRAALGDVNLGAIEEHERLSERVTFLTEQRDDLVEAQQQLERLIDEIDAEMANRFMETFRQIQAEFAHAFQILFNGGEADLSLTNPEDPLTTGIEVVAKPPGKRLQNLNLLSGGERALTAMALLFAILRVRPVPFCVLDEVEAALDEANVSRFAQQLKVFAAETQFIVITHRRGTMEEADALYGVTMPERGVSSLVSVRLADEIDYETA
ncbi:chromosome segregation protein SMC [Alicyclobacillus tengchongensis]|nr:chromosome segregation protein SMC [Alicyclobacillus tengchongensis]